MKKTLLLLLALSVSYFNLAQEKIPFVDFDSIISQVANEQQKGQYEKALEILGQINPNDSSYLSSVVTKSYFNILLKNYDEVIRLTDLGLQEDCKDLCSSYIINKVVALLGKEKYQEALNLCDEGLQKFPMNKTLWFNKGLSFESLGQIEDAVKMYQKVILLDPLYKKVYLQLGNICYKQELMSQALMCFDMYLLLEPDAENAFATLKSLNDVVRSKNKNSRNPNLNISIDDNSFEEIDLILNNRVAMNEKYETGNEIDIALTRQNHALLESLKNFTGNGGFWDKKFVPFYQWIVNNGHFDVFSYTLSYSIENESFKKIVEKKTDEISEFYGIAKQKWTDIVQKNTEEWYGKTETITYYYENGKLGAIGKMEDNTPSGKWNFYNDQGRLTVTGNFNSSGNREGDWTWYNYNGQKSETGNYIDGNLNGLNHQYYENGNKKIIASYKEGKLDGEYRYFTEKGALQQKKHFKNDLLAGTYQSFYDVGEELLESKVEYIEGNARGTYFEYYPTGTVKSEINFVNGENNGPEHSYYLNGKLSMDANSKDGYWNGPYKTYHPNGNPKEVGQTNTGYYVGHWQTFYSNGALESDFYYDDDGKTTGEYKYYDKDGKIHYQFEYRKGEVIAYKFYDKEGAVIDENRKKGGEFYYKGHSPYGKIISEGLYDIKGGKVGKWKYYTSHGVLSDEGNYEDNKLSGEYKKFYGNGELLSVSPYTNDTLNGYYAEYHLNGKLKSQGWYKDNLQHGEWRTYSPAGMVTAINFFHKGILHGEQQFFSGEGIKKNSSIYDFGENVKDIAYDKQGNIVYEINHRGHDGKYEMIVYHYNKKPSVKFTYVNGVKHGPCTLFDFYGRKKTTGEYLNGEMHGKWIWFHDNGNVETEANYMNGELEGDYVFYHEDGSIDLKYNYLLGKREGEVNSYYENGNIYTKVKYLNDEYHGRRETYGPDGNLQIVRFYEYGRMIGYSYLDENSKELPMIPIENETAKIVTYYDNGKVSREMEYKNGLLINEFKEYYYSGQLLEEVFYIDGEFDGKRSEYFSNGNVKEEEVYQLGKRDGIAKEYYSNGNLRKEVNYLYDIKEGVSKSYNEDGKLQKEELYFDDSIISSKTL
ncbi:hypothetical protein [Flagellimonas aurea]|uniref:hypothetical protein n=1 Tax=Flagellimonas aurea TaxID=2915619 RepID=UPI0035CF807D